MKTCGAEFSVALSFALFFCVQPGYAQGSGLERSFPQSKAQVEKAVQEIQAAAAGRLPVLDGFATSADHPLDRYRRGYYQSKIQVTAAPSGGIDCEHKRTGDRLVYGPSSDAFRISDPDLEWPAGSGCVGSIGGSARSQGTTSWGKRSGECAAQAGPIAEVFSRTGLVGESCCTRVEDANCIGACPLRAGAQTS